MLKFIKNNKWWVAIISVFAVFLSSFGIFAKSFVDSNKQKVVNKVENYIKASSYAVQSRILKETENLNEDYLNQKIGKKPLLNEFNNNFIWQPNNNKTTSLDTISDLWKTYFGSTDNVLKKDLQIQYQNNNKLENIKSSKGEITPKNIDFLLTISKSLEKFLNGFAPSLASLGISFLQSTVLQHRDDPNFEKYKSGITSVANAIEDNRETFNYLGKVLTPANLDENYYKNLTVKQAIIKNINQLASVITNNKDFASQTDVDKLPEALDKLLVDLELDSITNIFSDIDFKNFKAEKISEIFSKIKNLFNNGTFTKLKQKGLEILNKITPHLATYLYSELFFGLYYVANSDLKNPEDLLKQKVDDSVFIAFTKNKLDLNVLVDGLVKVLKNKKDFERLYDFIFKRFDQNKIFNNINTLGTDTGTGSLLYDLINWLEKKLYNVSNTLSTIIRFAELALNDANIQKTIKEKLVEFIKSKLPKISVGSWIVNFNKDELEVSLKIYLGFIPLRTPLQLKADFFGKTGLINNLINILKSFNSSINYAFEEFFKYIKNTLYLNTNKKFTLSPFVELVNNLNAFLKNDKNVYISLAKGLIGDLEIKTIYDFITLPYNKEFLNSLVQKYAGKDLQPVLDKIKAFLESLKTYGFIKEPEKLKEQFPQYLENLSKHLATYENNDLLNFNLLDSLYEGNIISDFISKWINFLTKDITKEDNPILPILRAINKSEKLEKLEQIKNQWTSKISDLAKKIDNYSNISKNRNIKLQLPKELVEQFGLQSLDGLNITELLEGLSNYIKDYLKANPNKVIGFNISSIGMMLSALTVKVGVEFRKDLSKHNFLYNKDSKQDKSKTVLKALADGFDSHDNSSDVGRDSTLNRKDQSYYNWDKIYFYINGFDKPYILDRTNLKEEFSYSPLHMLIGINPDKTTYFKGSIGYAIGSLFGGLNTTDPNYNLSIENKNDATGILNVFNYVLDQKDKELKKHEDQIATQYYDKDAWETKVINSSEDEINYELIRLKSSKTQESKQLGSRFKVKLAKKKHSSYWEITQIIAVDYKAA
ncbi:STREFT protein [Mycoplasma feriruminatoris]|uniref:STREFT protein n=1 Tax=Mycoplasma feriruminatoris TaxID=1179777 RepID=A0ABY8HW01_9MOLU|nr:STREFT protein [Mycoplasma feriruminatoris]WFQ93143.1 STREFT protein [Mycoplasma feriruminatoris]